MDAEQFVNSFAAAGEKLPPFIVVTGHASERKALDLIKLGARDYVVKDAACIERLPLVAARVLAEIESEKALRMERSRLDNILGSSGFAVHSLGLF